MPETAGISTKKSLTTFSVVSEITIHKHLSDGTLFRFKSMKKIPYKSNF